MRRGTIEGAGVVWIAKFLWKLGDESIRGGVLSDRESDEVESRFSLISSNEGDRTSSARREAWD